MNFFLHFNYSEEVNEMVFYFLKKCRDASDNLKAT